MVSKPPEPLELFDNLELRLFFHPSFAKILNPINRSLANWFPTPRIKAHWMRGPSALERVRPH